ncbi:MAG: peptide-methionine (R)-S-oxide reductase [Pseudanabaena frigida]|uniref:peptide-methionine (R)-S-oxide reductase n=1 Tax=Pseudanabaena frigida TaxID=945775 RepID=A0A2W4WIB1_9CYAN|nr:MAG: peptide-methionine (R)-S-oxide reductase [Pseudanabaena frigida]
MKKRDLLITGASVIGGAWLFQFWRSQSIESTPIDSAIALDTVDLTKATKKYKIMKTEDEWNQILTPEQFRVLRKHGTERSFSSPLDKEYSKGTYNCAGCDLPLFTSDTKFNSRTGWPSFFQPIDEAIATTVDTSLFMKRVEVHCSRCGGHLGHVFDDGPKPTGQRYCMNGVSLKFIPA